MAMEIQPGSHVGAWEGPPGLGGGSQHGRDGLGGPTRSSYVGISSLNTYVRDKKNLLEIRLERKDCSVNFNPIRDGPSAD